MCYTHSYCNRIVAGGGAGGGSSSGGESHSDKQMIRSVGSDNEDSGARWARCVITPGSDNNSCQQRLTLPLYSFQIGVDKPDETEKRRNKVDKKKKLINKYAQIKIKINAKRTHTHTPVKVPKVQSSNCICQMQQTLQLCRHNGNTPHPFSLFFFSFHLIGFICF